LASATPDASFTSAATVRVSPTDAKVAVLAGVSAIVAATGPVVVVVPLSLELLHAVAPSTRAASAKGRSERIMNGAPENRTWWENELAERAPASHARTTATMNKFPKRALPY
jgi:hypothetical protein